MVWLKPQSKNDYLYVPSNRNITFDPHEFPYWWNIKSYAQDTILINFSMTSSRSGSRFFPNHQLSIIQNIIGVKLFVNLQNWHLTKFDCIRYPSVSLLLSYFAYKAWDCVQTCIKGKAKHLFIKRPSVSLKGEISSGWDSNPAIFKHSIQRFLWHSILYWLFSLLHFSRMAYLLHYPSVICIYIVQCKCKYSA